MRTSALIERAPFRFSGAPINVKNPPYSAAGDGVADDTAAIQAALNDAVTKNVYAVYVPTGYYLLNGNLAVPETVSLLGAGGDSAVGGRGTGIYHGTTFLCGAAGAGISFGVLNTAHYGGEAANFSINGNGLATNPIWCGELVSRCFRNISVTGAMDVCWRLNQTQNCEFIGCEANHSTGGGLDIDQSTGGCVFLRCEFNDFGSYGVQIRQSVAAQPGAYTTPESNTFVHCIMERCKSTAMAHLYQTAGRHNSCFSCQFGTATSAPGIALVNVQNSSALGSTLEIVSGMFYGDPLADVDAIHVGDGAEVWVLSGTEFMSVRNVFYLDLGAPVVHTDNTLRLTTGIGAYSNNMVQAGLSVQTSDYQSLCETAFEQLLATTTPGPLLTARAAQSVAAGTAPQFSATVSTFNNSYLSTPAKVDIAGASDISGDRGQTVAIFGLSATGIYQSEQITLNASSSSTAVTSSGTYSALYILGVESSWTTGANITAKATGTSNVICTLPSGTGQYGKVSSTLVIPRHYGTFVSGGAFVTDRGWFETITAVYNITDDPGRTKNLLGGSGFTFAETATMGAGSMLGRGYSGCVSSFAVGSQIIYLSTGVGSAKTYEVQGTYVPYQGILNGSETLQLVYLSPKGYLSTSGVAVTVTAGTINPRYIPASVKLPLSPSYDETIMTRTVLSWSGIAAYGHSTALRPAQNDIWHESNSHLYSGAILTFSQAGGPAQRGFSRAFVDGTNILVGNTLTLGGTTQHGNYFPGLARVLVPGTNTALSAGELLLIVFATTANSGASVAWDASDAYKLVPAW